MRIQTLEELRPLLVRLPEQKRRAIVEAFRDAGERGARAINEALDLEDARRFDRRRELEESVPDGEKKPRGSKYGNQLVEHEGEIFHSLGEFRRWRVLELEQRAGVISGLERQVEYPICVAGEYICSWFADFRYTRHGSTVVEDFKGYRTEIYKLKKKFIEAIYKFRIFETGTKSKKREPTRKEPKKPKVKTYTATRRRTVRK
jgi:hypothetical protein